MCVCSVTWSCLTLCDPVDCSLSSSSAVEYFREEYWSGFPFPPPGDLPNPGTEPKSLSPALAGRFFTTAPTGGPTRKYGSAKRVWAVRGYEHSMSTCTGKDQGSTKNGPQPKADGWSVFINNVLSDHHLSLYC